MSLKIGRFGSDITINNGGAATWNRGSVDFSGVFVASSLEDAAVLRDQLVGHVDNPDELFVPVNLDSIDPKLSGFYSVAEASVTATKVSLAQVGVTRFAYSYSAKLVPVTRYASPIFESVVAAGFKTASLGSATQTIGLPVNAFSASIYNVDLGGSPASPSATSALRASADGSVYVIDGQLGVLFNTNSIYSVIWGCPYSSYYSGSCSIGAGANLRAVSGREAPAGAPWRIQNGLVRVTYVASSSDIDVAHWDGSTWDTKRYRFYADGTQLTAWKQWQILRNAPECVTIRLFSGSNGAAPARFVDLTLRRGSIIVDGLFTRLDTLPSGSASVSVGLTTPEPSANAIGFTTVNMGVKASGNDGQGNRYLIFGAYSTATSPALAIDTANSKITLSETVSVRPFPFGITSLVNYSTIAAPNREADLAPQFVAETGESVLAVS